MPPSVETVSTLLGLLYEAAAAPEHWPGFLSEFSSAARANTSYFVLSDERGGCDFSLNHGFDPGWQRAYTEHFHRHDVLFERFVANKRIRGEWIGTGQSVITDGEFQRSVFFNDFVLPQRQMHHCAAALGGLDDGVEGGIGMQRAPWEEPFGQETVALIALLAPHLSRALNTLRALSRERDRTEELRQTVECLGQGLVSLDARGRVIRMSATAQAILDSADGIRLEHGFLRAAVAKEQSRLSAIIGGAVATGRGAGTEFAVRASTAGAPQAGKNPLWTPSPGGAMLISRQPPRRPLQLAVSPFRSTGILLDDRPAALVFLGDPDERPASRAALLHSLYGLTPTECRLADLLAQGCEIAEIADRLRVAVETARSHLKAVFRKTGTGRQADLVRLILRLPGSWDGNAQSM